MRSKKIKKFSAFSLVEVSVVIIILGIFIAGVVVADGMVSKFRITAAQNLSRSSPVNEVSDAALWLETSLDSSFNGGEANNGSPLSTWYDQRNSTSKVAISTAGASPTYSNTINRVHAVEFDGSANKYFTFDGSFLNGTDYTIFVLEKRKSANTNNYFLGTVGSGSNNSLALGYSADSTVIHAQGSNSYNSSVTNYSGSVGNSRIFTFISSATSKKTYINGVLAAQSSSASQLSGISTLSIGQNYIGEIGEIAIFTRALEPDERIAIEDYVGKKWTSKINRNIVPSGSCVGYTVTASGCDLASANCSISQAGVSATVSATSSSTTLSCNLANYTGTISYTCASGVASVLGSCSCDAAHSGEGCASCASGYESVSGNCQAISCAASGTGLSGTVNQASGGLSCGSGYSGVVNYTCSNGTFAITSGSCSVQTNCTGGTISSSGGYTIHKFTTVGSSQKLNCPNTRNVEYLIVGGGGGAGAFNGGGGAGGLLSGTISVAAATDYIVTVGAGGSGENTVNSGGSNGGFSSFNGLTAIGGGKGWHNQAGSTGGSGGGSGYSSVTRAAGTAGQGNAGGAGANISNAWAGGGGGGAGSVGGDGTNGRGGDAGAGILSNITGTPTYYAVGGPGASYNSSATPLTSGAAAAGGSITGQAGAANTGNGGGTGLTTWNGMAGGSGIVIIRY